MRLNEAEREEEVVERGIVGNQRALYIAVSVGRYCIDRKYMVSKAGSARDNEPESELEKKEILLLVCVCVYEIRQYIIQNMSWFTCHHVLKIFKLLHMSFPDTLPFYF